MNFYSFIIIFLQMMINFIVHVFGYVVRLHSFIKIADIRMLEITLIENVTNNFIHIYLFCCIELSSAINN